MPLGIEVGLSPGDFVLDVYCGQTAGWMKMPLSTEIDLGPGHILLDGNPTPLSPPPAKGAQQPSFVFGPYLLWPRSPISASAKLLLAEADHRDESGES